MPKSALPRTGEEAQIRAQMDVNLLIDALVRQTTVLIAQLTTAAGGRAPLAHTANQVFVNLVRELKDQGLGNKVIADMFGLALRPYHGKVRRLSESTTVRGKSLWEATLEYVQEKETVLQTDVLHRFRRDDEALVRGVLTDLVESGMVFRSGRGARTTYRAARPEQYALADREEGGDGSANLVWVAISRFGSATAEAVSERRRAQGTASCGARASRHLCSRSLRRSARGRSCGAPRGNGPRSRSRRGTGASGARPEETGHRVHPQFCPARLVGLAVCAHPGPPFIEVLTMVMLHSH